MWVCKKILTGLALVVGLTGVAGAASKSDEVKVEPFHFDGIAETDQQFYWEQLLKFKLWGTHGISFGARAAFVDEIGWIGTADGDFEATNGDRRVLGGPIIVGGKLSLGQGSEITSGPVRVKNLYASGDAAAQYFRGQYCITGDLNDQAENAIIRGNGTFAKGEENAYSGACATDKVPDFYRNLSVPEVQGTHTYGAAITIGNGQTYNIDVPKGEGSYDIYIDKINFGDDSKLYVRMPYGGRLTRIITNSGINNGINMGQRDIIQVVYMPEGAFYDPSSKQYTAYDMNGVRYIKDDEYKGNLLIYTPNDLLFRQDFKSIQGTIISKGTITIASQSKFSGQLIAEKIVLNNDFSAEDFNFVPFGPSPFEMNKLVSQVLHETHKEKDSNNNCVKGQTCSYVGDTIKVSLSEKTDNIVKFKYCFKFEGDPGYDAFGYANGNDADSTKTKELEYPGLEYPLCSLNEFGERTINIGEDKPSKPIVIWINDDDVLEQKFEAFTFRIYDLKGALFAGDFTEQNVTMSIEDNENAAELVPACSDFSIGGKEDVSFKIPTFPIIDQTTGSSIVGNYTITITSLSAGFDGSGDKPYSLTSGGKAVAKNQTLTSADLSSLTFKGGKDKSGDNYAKIEYSASVDGKVTGSCTLTINLDEVNDPPQVEGKISFTIPEGNYKVSNKVVGNIVAYAKNPAGVSIVDDKTPVDNLKFSLNKTYHDPETFEFAVNEKGDITAVGEIDYEGIDPKYYTLIVDVTDGDGASTSISIQVNISDENEAPSGSSPGGSIMENKTYSSPIAYVGAQDPEEPFEKLNFKIDGEIANKLFKICDAAVANNKGICLVQPVDYETIDAPSSAYKDICKADKDGKYCAINVIVTDNGVVVGGKQDARTSTPIPVEIRILDDNDPVSATGFTVAVDENVPEGMLDGTITVTDEDDKTFKYSIFSGNGEKIFKIDENTGAISVVGKIDFENYDEGKAAYKLVIEVKDARATGSNADTAIVNITINDVNEPPSVKNQEFAVYENKTVGTVVGTVPVEDEDYREVNRQNVLSLSGDDAKYFEIDAKTGVIKTKEVFDYEARKQYKFKVTVEDQDGFTSTADVVVNVKNVPESSAIVVDRVETGSGAKAWSKDTVDLTKTVIYTNEKNVIIKWSADGKAQPDTLVQNLKEGFNTITLEYCDKTKDACTKSEVVVFVSTKTPEVTVTAKEDKEEDKNIFTIAEEKAPGDTSIYVNAANSDLVITVKEPILDSTYTDSTCNYNTSSVKVNTKLETVTVPQDAYKALNEIVKEAPTLDVAPSGEVTYSAYNDDQVKVTYTQKTQTGKTIYVSYITDQKGNVVKEAVVGPNGKIDSVEVMTVSYKVSVDGKMVTVSYEADAITGQALKTVANNTSSNSSAGSTSGSTAGKPGSSSTSGSTSGSNGGSTSGSTGGSSTAGNGSSSGSTSGNGANGGSANGGSATTSVNKSLSSGEILFTVSYEYESKASNGNDATVNVAYTVNQSGKVTKDADGNIGYQVTYTYTNVFGNSASESVFIVVDVIPPVVKILSPTMDSVLYTNDVDVVWTVDLGDGRGPQIQDSLTSEGLEAGKVNEIIRFYRDKAGNEASDVVYVMVKNTKDVDIRVEKPVTIVTREDVEKFYAEHKPEEGQTFAISIYNPHSGKEVETQIGGSFKTKTGSGESTYPDSLQGTHLGPTLGITAKVPTINSVAGLATLDDLVGDDGMILLDKVDAAGSKKVSVDEYVHDYCTAEFQGSVGSDISMSNLYKTVFEAKIWVYTSLGQFVDEFHFSQDLNDPSYISDGGVLKMYFEQKPDENGDLRTKDGRLYATGAYIYKTEMNLRSTLQCTLPPTDDASKKNTMGAKTKTKEDMLKPFGYKRPSKK